jgi:hypothetical protein
VTLPPVVLLCIVIFVNTFSVGAFPVLLPEMGRAGGLSDVSLGIVAAAFGVDARRDRVEQIITTVLDLAEGPVVAAGCQETGKSADRSGRLITMLGGSIAAVSARPQLPLIGHSPPTLRDAVLTPHLDYIVADSMKNL